MAKYVNFDKFIWSIGSLISLCDPISPIVVRRVAFLTFEYVQVFFSETTSLRVILTKLGVYYQKRNGNINCEICDPHLPEAITTLEHNNIGKKNVLKICNFLKIFFLTT